MDDESENVELTNELMTFAYRMLGSAIEAEGAVNGVLSSESDEREAQFRLLIADCVDRVEGAPPRSLPIASIEDLSNPLWLEPFPDDLYQPAVEGAEVRYDERESISLYFVLALQSVSPDHRAALLLRDVMGWSAQEARAVLRQEAADVEHLLDEGRAAFSQEYKPEMGRREPPPESEAFSFFMKYLYQWETANSVGFTALLSENTLLQEVPSGEYFEGSDAIRDHVSSTWFAGEALRRWRLLPKRANGQLAYCVYKHNEARRSYQAHSIQVPHFDEEGVSEIISFGFPKLFPLFGLLPEMPEQG